jgi:hypothetical protein
LVPNAALNDWLFIQVIAAPVSNSQDVVWFPDLTLILGRIFSPGENISCNLLQVINDARDKLIRSAAPQVSHLKFSFILTKSSWRENI